MKKVSTWLSSKFTYVYWKSLLNIFVAGLMQAIYFHQVSFCYCKR